MDFIIKELTIDLLQLNGLLETLSHMRETGNISIENRIKILKKIDYQDSHIFVAINNTEIIGTSTVLIEQKYIRNGACVCHIEDVSVNKRFIGLGIGKSVMKESIKYAKKRNCYKIILDCSNEVKPFYEKFGFKKEDNHMRINL